MLTLLMNFMNCMKKLLSIKIIIVSLLMVFAITTIVLALVNRKKVNYYMTYLKEYYLMNDNKSLAHTTWNCKYHIVFAPKYRKKVFYEKKD